ncbi:MAG: hypothetical protein EOR81_12290 [Mesorhizobium sp.]|nr:MAG: hypothetical protein EOR81_12290 [Mesorhizobium sp.]
MGVYNATYTQPEGGTTHLHVDDEDIESYSYSAHTEDGTAKAGKDYTEATYSGSGTAPVNIDVGSLDDDVWEGPKPETFFIKGSADIVSEDDDGNLVSEHWTGTLTFEIDDHEDKPKISIGSVLSEGSPVALEISATHPCTEPYTIHVHIDDSAAPFEQTDFNVEMPAFETQAHITLVPKLDQFPVEPSSYTISATADAFGESLDVSSGQVDLSGIVVSITASKEHVEEGSNGTGETLTYTIDRTGPTDKALVVSYRFEDTFFSAGGSERARATVDLHGVFNPQDNIIIEAGSKSVDLKFETFGDNVPELNVPVGISMVASPKYSIGTGMATITIDNDDGGQTFDNTMRGVFKSVIDAAYPSHAALPSNEKAFISESWGAVLDIRDAYPHLLSLRDADYYLQEIKFLQDAPILKAPLDAFFSAILALGYDLDKAAGTKIYETLMGNDNPNNPQTPAGGAAFALRGIVDFFTDGWKAYLPASTFAATGVQGYEVTALDAPADNFSFPSFDTILIRSSATVFPLATFNSPLGQLVRVDDFPAVMPGKSLLVDLDGGPATLSDVSEILVAGIKSGDYHLEAGDDTFVAFAGSHHVDAGTGSDQIALGDGGGEARGGAGDDLIFGGKGVDVAIFEGSRSDYKASLESDGFIAIADSRPLAPDGTDRILGVDFLRFADGAFSVADLFPTSTCPVIDRPGTQDGSASTNDTLTAPAYHNTFFVSEEGVSGKDRITNFGKDDVFASSKALFDSNGDGIITFGTNKVLDLDGPDAGLDTVSFDGLDAKKGLRFLGEGCEDVFVYATATVRPKGALEGKLGDDALAGDNPDAKANKFFFDTALDLNLGHDKITNFGAKDILVTTTKLFDSNNDGKIGFGSNNLLDLSGGVGGPGDPGLPGEVGNVDIKNATGNAVTTLEFDGQVDHSGVNYYVYSGIGSAAGLGDLLFA